MAKKVIIVGIDGANPPFVERLVQEGRLPNFKRMMDEGTYAPHCCSSLPTSTPENWTTIATGAWNGTHQVMSFQVFQPPELHGNWMAGYTSAESQADFIWDAVERAGKESILLKYPASHPPTMKTGVQVCGCHVRPCAHQIDGAHLFATVEPRNAALRLRPAPDPAVLPEGKLPWLSGELLFEARGLGAPSMGAGLDEGTAYYGVPDIERIKPQNASLNTPVCKLVPPGKKLYAFVGATKKEDYDLVIVARDAAARERIAELYVGDWSAWTEEPFETVDGPRQGTLRFKLVALSPDAKIVKLYATQIMDVDHYAQPTSVGRELYRNVGPFITDIGWEGLGHDYTKAWFDESVMVDLADYQHDWFVKAIAYLSQTHNWSLCMLQSHCIDCANHHCLWLADPASNKEWPDLQRRYLAFIDRLYESLDRMLGGIMALADEKTVIFVVSDHGGVANPYNVNTRQVLQEAGLLVEKDGEIDWARTRAYVQNHLFVNVNLQGREPQGIVPPEEFDKTCDEIVAALHAYVDPRLGLHPFNLALRKVDARYLGLYGDPTAKKIGDVVFALREPYGGNHGQLSTHAWGIGSTGSLFLVKGPGIRRGARLKRTVWLTDIVPTACHLLQIPVPRDTEGAIIYQALEEGTY